MHAACMPEQLSCFGNGSICVEMYHLCNGVFECPNGFDEGNCSEYKMRQVIGIIEGSKTSSSSLSKNRRVWNCLKCTKVD